MNIKHTFISPQAIVSAALICVTLAVNVAMPLFNVYAQNAHFNQMQTSLVLAAYILGMLPCYVFLGGISDKLGRKPILILSVFFSLLATIILFFFPNIYALIVARICQGIGLGLSMGTGTAFIAEILKYHHITSANEQAANISSLSTAFGFSGGAVLTTIFLLQKPSLTPLSYPIIITITSIVLVSLFFLPHYKPIGGNIIRLPYFPKNSFPINLSIAICWAATGTVIAIVPKQMSVFGLSAYAGFCLMFINWSGAIIQPFIKKYNAIRLIRIGTYLIPIGFALTIIGNHYGILSVLLFGTFILGLAAYGFSFIGGMQTISIMSGSQRARGVSGYMYYGYIGFGIPAIFLGYIADVLSISYALIVFEIVIIILSIYVLIRLNKKI